MSKRLLKLATPPIDKSGNLLFGFVSLGNGYYDCEERAVLPKDATILGTDSSRYADLGQSDKDKLFRCPIIRPKVTPSSGSKPTPRSSQEEIAKAQSDLNAGKSDMAMVSVADLKPGDVVLDFPSVPHLWAGE